LGFQEDSQSLSRAQSRVYDSLSDTGWIVDADGYWFLTPEGEQELARLSTIQQGVAEGSENIKISDDKSIVTISVDGKDRFILQPAEGHKPKTYGGRACKYWTIYDIERKKTRKNPAIGMPSKNQAIAHVKKLVRLENKSQQAVKEGEGFDQEAGIGLDGKSFKFKIRNLVAFAENYPVNKIDPNQFADQIAGREEDNAQSMARAEKADLQYPIIVVKRQNGQLWIADGTHRAHKAILNKLPSIKARIIPIKDMSSFAAKQSVKEGSLADAAKHVKKGALHKQEHIPLDKKIGATKLKSLKAHGTPLERKRANFALNIQGIKEGWKDNLGNAAKVAAIAGGAIGLGVGADYLDKKTPHVNINGEEIRIAPNKGAGSIPPSAEIVTGKDGKKYYVYQYRGSMKQPGHTFATPVDEDAVTDPEHDMKPHSNYTAIDHLMKYLAAKHHITPEELHDKFVNKHHMIPDEWIKDKPMSENDFDDSYDSGVRFDYDEHTARMARLKQKALASQKLKAQGKKPEARLNPKTGKYYVDFTAGPDYVDEDPFRG